MRNRFRLSFLLVTGLLLAGGSAMAARYDLSLGRFWEKQSCSDPSQLDTCANGYFKSLMTELGVVTAPVFLAPAETLGLNGFEFSLEGSIVPIRSDEKYWTLATEGKPQSVMFVPHLHARKGLPFSFELGTQLSYVPDSKLFVVGAELKWSLNEGFYYIPDLSVRLAVNHALGSKDFELSTGGWDISLSKAFGIAGMFSLTPYAGYNMLFVNATSHLVLAWIETSPTVVEKQTKVFNSVNWQDNMFHRFFVGCRLKTHIFQIVAEGSFTSKSLNIFSFKLGFDY